MEVVLAPLLQLIAFVMQLYVWIIMGSVILSWLVGFGVINPHHPSIRVLSLALYRLTEPCLAPIRRILPDLGGLDLSPLVLILGLFFLQNVLAQILRKWLMF